MKSQDVEPVAVCLHDPGGCRGEVGRFEEAFDRRGGDFGSLEADHRHDCDAACAGDRDPDESAVDVLNGAGVLAADVGLRTLDTAEGDALAQYGAILGTSNPGVAEAIYRALLRAAARAIRAGEAGLMIAGGVESMTRAPFVIVSSSGGARMMEGALSLIGGSSVHEFVHDARHLLGFPCH